MIPLVHDLANKSIVVFGGGEVGTRKARVFSTEAKVTVVAKEFTEDLKQMDLTLRETVLSKEEDVHEIIETLGNPFLAVTATGIPELDEMIAEVSREKGLLVNKTSGEIGDVITPSIIDRDPVIIAITTQGSSPAMSKYLRKKLGPLLDKSSLMVELQSELRDELKGHPDREELLWEVIEDEKVWEAFEEDYDKGKKLAYEVIEADEN
ncbi:MAG: bifunctional precorrin-2 dehydrogenase/sirohydrochlorin ferrochelatase [Candidatus Bipolaricaulota bacterium]|nr:bifunctional precorrin-2 dehydrogenase/sirohydrochlorin ferrochelatase [Candidatus Bipolaricaulota bacterium]